MQGSNAFRFVRRGWAMAMAAIVCAAAPAAHAADEVRVDYDNWQLFCPATKAGAAQECEIHQLLANKGQLAAGMYVAKRGSVKMLAVRTPLGVALNKNLMLQIGSGIGTDALTFMRCDTGGCIAHMLATEPLLNSLRSGTEVTLTMYGDSNTPLPVKFDLKGFAAAEKALNERK
jgi:invasion protein IalB